MVCCLCSRCVRVMLRQPSIGNRDLPNRRFGVYGGSNVVAWNCSICLGLVLSGAIPELDHGPEVARFSSIPTAGAF